MKLTQVAALLAVALFPSQPIPQFWPASAQRQTFVGASASQESGANPPWRNPFVESFDEPESSLLADERLDLTIASLDLSAEQLSKFEMIGRDAVIMESEILGSYGSALTPSELSALTNAAFEDLRAPSYALLAPEQRQILDSFFLDDPLGLSFRDFLKAVNRGRYGPSLASFIIEGMSSPIQRDLVAEIRHQFAEGLDIVETATDGSDSASDPP